jgi:hypothetical protein
MPVVARYESVKHEPVKLEPMKLDPVKQETLMEIETPTINNKLTPLMRNLSVDALKPIHIDKQMECYIMDMCEDNNNPDSVFLFGKISNNKSYESVCVQVKGLMRQVFMVPKKQVISLLLIILSCLARLAKMNASNACLRSWTA